MEQGLTTLVSAEKENEPEKDREKAVEVDCERKEVQIAQNDSKNEFEECQIRKEWSTVSPAKASRSPGKQYTNLIYGQVQIISPSKFSALSETGENGEDLRDHEDLELDVVDTDGEDEVGKRIKQKGM